MNSRLASTRIEQRLNKLSSEDYDWVRLNHKEEATNKALNDWVRRQHHGSNMFLEGDEETEQRVDDLQILLKEAPLDVKNSGKYSITKELPEDYRYYKRVTPVVSKEPCSGVCIKSRLVEEANVDEYLRDWTFRPSFDFEETFHTIMGNKIKVFHNDDFDIDNIVLTYYRNPLYIHYIDKDKSLEEWEWKDDVAELIIDEAVKLIAGDTENSYQLQNASNRVQNNN